MACRAPEKIQVKTEFSHCIYNDHLFNIFRKMSDLGMKIIAEDDRKEDKRMAEKRKGPGTFGPPIYPVVTGPPPTHTAFTQKTDSGNQIGFGPVGHELNRNRSGFGIMPRPGVLIMPEKRPDEFGIVPRPEMQSTKQDGCVNFDKPNEMTVGPGPVAEKGGCVNFDKPDEAIIVPAKRPATLDLPPKTGDLITFDEGTGHPTTFKKLPDPPFEPISELNQLSIAEMELDGEIWKSPKNGCVVPLPLGAQEKRKQILELIEPHKLELSMADNHTRIVKISTDAAEAGKKVLRIYKMPWPWQYHCYFCLKQLLISPWQ